MPPSGRVLPGMPLEMDDADDDDPPHEAGPRFGSRFGKSRFSQPSSGTWWKPASTLGRVALGVGVLAMLGSSHACPRVVFALPSLAQSAAKAN